MNDERPEGLEVLGRRYPSGANAPVEAAAAALERARNARFVVLVEGVSDHIAIDTLADQLGRDLAAEGVVVVPIGGAQAISRYLERFGPSGADIGVAGLCDASEEHYFMRAVAEVGLGTARTRHDLEALGFFTCDKDLEDELIRAVGREAIEAVLDSQGDLSSFRTLQKQPAWSDRPFDDQAHRWLKAGARRTLRYAHLLALAMPMDRMPLPLRGVLEASGP
jgi:Overcoming lysogenization defect protein-like, TOPRIM domain